MQEEAKTSLLIGGGDLAVRLSTSLTAQPLTLDDRDAREGVPFAQDATKLGRLVLEANHVRRSRDPLIVGVVGALIMLVASVEVALAAVAFRLPALVIVPVMLGCPLFGWLPTVFGGER